uniref:Uncharacterized protein n=1 Tax=Cuerna arida TaxID=1464854 RepID=A0A1B6GFW2_9HEMI
MSKTEMIESGSKWVEEDLSKLSCKDLKKLAKENSIRANPNSRKADLVKALLNSSIVNVSLVDKSDIMETDKRVRMTRSRASMFQPLYAMQDDLSTSNKISANTDEKEQFDKEMESSNKVKRKNKSKINSEIEINLKNEELISSNLTEIFNIVSSVQKKSRPLTEITNNDVLSKKESDQTNCADNKNLSKPKRRKGKTVVKSLSTENLNVESEQMCKTQCLQNESDEREKEEINSSISVTFDDSKIVKKSKGKGKKAKVADESVVKKVESTVEESTTNNQSENVDAENNRTFVISYHEDNLDSKKELNNFPITITDSKNPRKKTGGRGKKAKERERNLESEEICSNVTTDLSIDRQTEEFLTSDNSPVEDKKRKQNRNKSHEMEDSAQSSNSSLPPKDGQCETKKRKLRKTSKENYETSVKKEEDSLMMTESKNKSLTSKTQSNSIMSDLIECPSTSNSRRNIKNTKSESESNNSKLKVDSPQNTNLTESLESNKTSTDKTPDTVNMPVRTSNVSSVTSDSADTSRKTRSSQNMCKFEPPLRCSTFIIEEGAGGQTPTSSLSKNQADLPSCSSTFRVDKEALVSMKQWLQEAFQFALCTVYQSSLCLVHHGF